MRAVIYLMVFYIAVCHLQRLNCENAATVLPVPFMSVQLGRLVTHM